MGAWDLPTSIEVHGIEYNIRSDFRAIIDILTAMNDPDLFEPGTGENEQNLIKAMVMLDILFCEEIPVEDLQEACDKASEFIDMGMPEDKNPVRVMDWEQDAKLIMPAVNKVAGTEIRSLPYVHWWTFMGYYMEIGECLFSSVLNIRQKKSKCKKLEKWETEFYKENKAIIDLKSKEVQHNTKEQMDEVRALLGLK